MLRRLTTYYKEQKSESKKGFTLIEIMVAVAILSFGIVAIYEALFICLDTFSFYSNCLNAQNWIGETIGDIQEELISTQLIAPAANGRVVLRNKNFDWQLSINPIGMGPGLYQLDLSVFWQQGTRRVNMSRAAYVFNPRLTAEAK